jgi:hypothetical protein
MNGLARQSRSTLINYVTAIAFFSFSSVGHAATTLEQLLAALEANPMLEYNGIYLNYSEVILDGASSAMNMIDGSVIVTYGAQAVIVGQSTTPDAEQSEEMQVPLQPYPSQISTSVIGGSNVGMIEIDHAPKFVGVEGELGMALPGQGVLVLNRASTQAQIVGSVTMDLNGNPLPTAEISTSAIGASNIGSISVHLQNDGAILDRGFK